MRLRVQADVPVLVWKTKRKPAGQGSFSMLYKNGMLLGLDGEPVKPQAVTTVRRYQKKALEKLTEGERDFCKLIGPVCKHGRVRYVKQVVVYVTAGISFRLDFLFRDYRVAIEIDGENHRAPNQRELDEWRTKVLVETMKLKVLRFTNEEVAHQYLEVREAVVKALLESPVGYKRYLLEKYPPVGKPVLADS